MRIIRNHGKLKTEESKEKIIIKEEFQAAEEKNETAEGTGETEENEESQKEEMPVIEQEKEFFSVLEASDEISKEGLV